MIEWDYYNLKSDWKDRSYMAILTFASVLHESTGTLHGPRG